MDDAHITLAQIVNPSPLLEKNWGIMRGKTKAYHAIIGVILVATALEQKYQSCSSIILRVPRLLQV